MKHKSKKKYYLKVGFTKDGDKIKMEDFEAPDDIGLSVNDVANMFIFAAASFLRVLANQNPLQSNQILKNAYIELYEAIIGSIEKKKTVN